MRYYDFAEQLIMICDDVNKCKRDVDEELKAKLERIRIFAINAAWPTLREECLTPEWRNRRTAWNPE